MRVCVIGGGRVGEDDRERAAAVGRELAERGHEVVCGGLGGVMEAACRGAKEATADPEERTTTADAGGRTIGILPTDDPDDANAFVDVPIATGMGNARNALVVANGDAAIAIDGNYGTLSEIALALDRRLPVAAIGSHDVEGVEAVASAAEAVAYVEDRASSSDSVQAK